MNISATASTVELNGDSYKKGAVRVAYSGSIISIFYPYSNNQALASKPFNEYSINGTECSSVDTFRAFERTNFY